MLDIEKLFSPLPPFPSRNDVHIWLFAFGILISSRADYIQGTWFCRLFEDVGPALQQIVEEGINVYVYSSGSVEAQKLLFGNTEEGDLLEVSTFSLSVDSFP